MRTCAVCKLALQGSQMHQRERCPDQHHSDPFGVNGLLTLWSQGLTPLAIDCHPSGVREFGI